MRKFSISALTIGVLLIMAGLRAVDLHWSREDTLRTAESRAANLALIVSAYLGEAFAGADAALRQLTVHSQRVGGPSAPSGDWASILVAAKVGLTGVGAISIVDREGVIRHSTRPEVVGQSRRDQFIVREAIAAPGDDLVVDTPFQSPIYPAQLLLPIGRRLRSREGRVEGAVVASFLPAAPRPFFRNIDIGQRGTVWVFHPTGVVLFREPSTTEAIGRPAKDNPIFRAALQSSGEGTLRVPLEQGGPVMLNAFHTRSTPPLIVAVSLDRDEVLTDWRHEAVGTVVVFAVVALTLATTLIVLFRQMNAKAMVERAFANAQQLEAARLRESNDRLESSLQREKHARRDAEAASALKDQFLMTVSHELRTPLTAIYGWARMLVDGAVSERQRDTALRTIERNAQAQTRLIDDLLDVARVMNGQLRLDVRPTNIGTVVQNAIETAKPAAGAKSIHLESRVDPAVGRVSADPDRLQQVVWNLLSNAVKFTSNGGRVDVEAVRTGVEIEIRVTDTGAGIASDFLPHVFERFRQEEAGTKRRYGGLGIGLAIVRNLVELHGGSVTAHSEGTGHGATFTVRLPASGPPVTAAAGALPSAGADATAAASGRKRLEGVRVLIVDDDAEARSLFATILEGAGATANCAASAGDALTILRRESHDVILSDIEMPEADGYGLVHHALAIARDRGERLMAVAVTAYSRPEDEARSLESGFHSHLRKPIDPATLVAAIGSITPKSSSV